MGSEVIWVHIPPIAGDAAVVAAIIAALANVFISIINNRATKKDKEGDNEVPLSAQLIRATRENVNLSNKIIELSNQLDSVKDQLHQEQIQRERERLESSRQIQGLSERIEKLRKELALKN